MVCFEIKLTLSFPKALTIKMQYKTQVSFCNVVEQTPRIPHENAASERSFEWSHVVVSDTNTRAQV